MTEELHDLPELIDSDDTVIAIHNEEVFTVDSDSKAEWALKKVKALREERDRLLAVVDDQISYYQQRRQSIEEKSEREEQYFIQQLAGYFEKVPHRKTKTQEQYELPSGKLVARTKPDGYERGAELITELQQMNLAKYLEFKPSVKWAELKKRVTVIDGQVNIIDDDGELHPSEQIKHVPGETIFEVKA